MADFSWCLAQQKKKKLFDCAKSDPQPYSDDQIRTMCNTFSAVWKYGLCESVRIRGMSFQGMYKCILNYCLTYVLVITYRRLCFKLFQGVYSLGAEFILSSDTPIFQ